MIHFIPLHRYHQCTIVVHVLRTIYNILRYLVLSSGSLDSLSVQSDLLWSKMKFGVELESSSESLKS